MKFSLSDQIRSDGVTLRLSLHFIFIRRSLSSLASFAAVHAALSAFATFASFAAFAFILRFKDHLPTPHKDLDKVNWGEYSNPHCGKWVFEQAPNGVVNEVKTHFTWAHIKQR